MFKLLYLIKRRSELSQPAFESYCSQQHSALVQAIPGLRKLVMNFVAPQPEGADAPDAVVELYFDDEASFNAALASEQAHAATQDHDNFVATDRTKVLIVEERRILG